MNFRTFMALCLINVVINTDALTLNFTVTEKPIPGQCKKFHMDFRAETTCGYYWPNYFGWDLFGNETQDTFHHQQFYNFFVHFQLDCLRYNDINLNSRRLACAVLYPACIDVTDYPKGVNDQPMVQVAPPCRSLCLELRRVITPGAFQITECKAYLENCNDYPRPRDSNFLCVPPSFN